MMKLYQFEFLLFLLLIIVNTTLSIPFSSYSFLPRFFKGTDKYIRHPATDYVFNKALEQIKPSPDPSPQLPKEIQGLYIIKQYLSDFGYLQQSGPFNNFTDQETISAIKTYQQYFNLQATGNGNLFNRIFLQHIFLPRCGVPDMNFKYDFTNNNISFPKGNQWFPNGTKYLTYGFAPESEIPLNITNVFRKALTRWSQTTKVLNFTETKSYDDADIKIAFYSTNGVFDGVVGGTVIKLDSNVKSGFIILDDSKPWVLPTQDGEFDLETTAMHQIGHLLGLDHSSDIKSIMYPTILPSQQRKVQISISDTLAIQKLYASPSPVTSNANSHYSSGLFTSLSIGFAFVALLN